MIIQRSKEIETELNSTSERITGLKTQLNEQSAAFETAQAAFVGGKASLTHCTPNNQN
jgi:hypothetical protein